MTELNRLVDKLSISHSIKERAALVYRKVLDKGLVRGRLISAMVAASLYVACRINKNPRPLHEIAKASLVHKKEVSCYYRLILKELNIKMPIDTPITYVSKIAETLGISNKIQGITVRILMEAKKCRVTSGKNPVGLVASALYLACLRNHEKLKQKDIAAVAGVTEVTIRNLCKTLKRELVLEL
jgi:transcription initiation factor TFIIB